MSVPLHIGRGDGTEPPLVRISGHATAHSAVASAKVAVSMTARKCTSPSTTRS